MPHLHGEQALVIAADDDNDHRLGASTGFGRR